MRVRLRIPELMAARGLTTAYALSKATGDRLPLSTAYRLVDAGGKLDTYASGLLDILADTFQPKNFGDLFDRSDDVPPPPAKRPRKRPIR